MPVLSHMELRAILQTARESVLDVLEVRFATVPTELIETINQIEDASVLKQLHRQAITISSIAQFQQLLSPNEAEGLGK